MTKYFLPVLLLLMPIAGCSRNSGQTPPTGGSPGGTPGPAEKETIVTSEPLPTFSGAHSFAFLTAQTGFGPRNPNSAGHGACLSYLVSTLRSLADDVRLQEFTHTGYGGEQLHLTNIVARFRPGDSTRILLCAHWDTRPRAEQDPAKEKRRDPILGANDGASGVAVLLEIASLLKAHPPSVGVDIALFDGEDYGREGDHGSYLLGSRYFAEHKRE
ncbi:MAG TPA: M28 family peptidase, partial [Bacteroidota bacterium]|nr:M28 family peptidase [Bacteroidota bacterium]